MKKILIIMVALTVGFAFATTTLAAEKKAAEPAKEEKKAPEKVTQTTGEVTAVDAKAMTVTVKGAKGDVTVAVPDMKMMEGIKVGDKVTCKHVEKDGKMVCTGIAKAMEKKMEKKEGK